MNIRADIAELLRQGHSDRAIARQLGCDKSTAARVRRILGIPPAQVPPPPNRSELTLEQKWATYTQPTDGGHLLWTGRVATNGTPVFKHRGRDHSAYRVAYRIRTGHDPVGYAKPGCEVPGCVAPACVDDTTTRQRDRAAYAAITGRWHRLDEHCRRGHAYAEHGRRLPDGSRYCHACMAHNRRQRREAPSVRL